MCSSLSRETEPQEGSNSSEAPGSWAFGSDTAPGRESRCDKRVEASAWHKTKLLMREIMLKVK